MNLFRFQRAGSDEVKDGKVISYSEINVVSDTEINARVKAKRKSDPETGLSSDYILIKTFELNKDWK